MSERSFGLIRANGTGKMSGTPDRAVVSFSVTGRAVASQAEATKNQADDFAKVKQALVGIGAIAGLKDHRNLSSSNLVFGPEYDYSSRKRKRTGFKSSQRLVIRVPLEVGERVVDALSLLTNEDEEETKVTFEISNYAQLQEQALDLAIKSLMENAKNRASALGVRIDLSDLYEFSENPEGRSLAYQRGVMTASLAAGAEGGSAPDLAVGEQDVVVTVSGSYRINNGIAL